MKINKISYNKKEGKLSFIIRDTTPAFMNMLRRIIIENVPTLAIEEVEFHKNDSILYDEMIAHRLGLTPLTTDLKTYNLPENCKCKGKGCARCSVKLVLNEKGPKTVYASSLKSDDPKVKPAFPKTPIVKLLKEQKLHFIATAILGQGKTHTKWNPSRAYYKTIPIIEIKKDKSEVLKVLKACKLDAIEESKGKIIVINPQVPTTELCNNCMEKVANKVEFKESKNDIIFFIESWGQLSPKEIVVKAIDMAQEKLDKFVEKIKNTK